jgi:hypothetical protein
MPIALVWDGAPIVAQEPSTGTAPVPGGFSHVQCRVAAAGLALRARRRRPLRVPSRLPPFVLRACAI